MAFSVTDLAKWLIASSPGILRGPTKWRS